MAHDPVTREQYDPNKHTRPNPPKNQPAHQPAKGRDHNQPAHNPVGRKR